jgi:preprotein translocase subunit SecY
MPTPEAPIVASITALTSLGILPYLTAGFVLFLAGVVWKKFRR